jgi:hypothetical protein
MVYSSPLGAALALNYGGAGAVLETGTTAVTGDFRAILALEDSVFSLLTASNWSGDSTASFPLPKGTTIFGAFSAFTLTSGKVLAYKNPPATF